MQKFIPIHTGCQYYDKDNKSCSRNNKSCHLLTPCILQKTNYKSKRKGVKNK